MKISEHFGVYGVCIRNNKLLCVKKHGGPYNGRYDLPGGSRKNGESLLDTLYREMSEETSYQVSQIYDPDRYEQMFNNVRISPKVREIIERTHIPNEVLVTRFNGYTARRERAIVEVDGRDGNESFDYTRSYGVGHASFNDVSRGGELKAEDIG